MNPPPGGREWRRFYSSHSRYHPPYVGGDWHNVRNEEREEYWPRYEGDASQRDNFYPPPQDSYGGYQSYYPPAHPSECHSFDTSDSRYPPPDSGPVAIYGPPTTNFSEDVPVTWKSCDEGALATKYEPFAATSFSENVQGTQRFHDEDTPVTKRETFLATNVCEDVQSTQRSNDKDDQSHIDGSAHTPPGDEQHKREPPSPCSSAENSSNTETDETSCDSSRNMLGEVAAVDLEQANGKFQDEVKQFVTKRRVVFDKLLCDVVGKEEECPTSAIHGCGGGFMNLLSTTIRTMLVFICLSKDK